MRRVLSVVSTRSDAIKLAPVILELEKDPDCFENLVYAAAEDGPVLREVLDWFGIQPRYVRDVGPAEQSPSSLAGRALIAMAGVLEEVRPDVVLVQGDTISSVATGLAAFCHSLILGHRGAGQRAGEWQQLAGPATCRRLADLPAALHFAPTRRAAAVLEAERVPPESIFVTGSTVVDALLMTVKRPLPPAYSSASKGKRLILVAACHAGATFAPCGALCRALADLARRNQDVEILIPAPLDCTERADLMRMFARQARVHLVGPLRYEETVHLMAQAYLVLTDSGRVQEEAPVFGKPVLVLRETTEQQEALEAGAARLVGLDPARIVMEAEYLLRDEDAYYDMALSGSPFGDGGAAQRIVNILRAT